MKYTLVFYITVFIYIYAIITGNVNMTEQAFRAATIIGLSGCVSALSKNK
jgi:hypothetical protein